MQMMVSRGDMFEKPTCMFEKAVDCPGGRRCGGWPAVVVELAWSATSDCTHGSACETRLLRADSGGHGRIKGGTKGLRVQPACPEADKTGGDGGWKVYLRLAPRLVLASWLPTDMGMLRIEIAAR